MPYKECSFAILKSTHFKILQSICLGGLFKLNGFSIERAYGQITGFGSFFKGHFLISPCFVNIIEVIWKWSWSLPNFTPRAFAAAMPSACRLPDVGALVLRHKGEHLQHDVAQESAHQVFATPGVPAAAYPAPRCQPPFVWVSQPPLSKLPP